MHDHALDHGPCKSGGLYLGLALGDLVGRPGAAVVEVMQRRHHAGRAGLADMGQKDGIVRSEPSPGLFHARFSCSQKGSERGGDAAPCAECRDERRRAFPAPRGARCLCAKPARSKTARPCPPAELPGFGDPGQRRVERIGEMACRQRRPAQLGGTYPCGDGQASDDRRLGPPASRSSAEPTMRCGSFWLPSLAICAVRCASAELSKRSVRSPT